MKREMLGRWLVILSAAVLMRNSPTLLFAQSQEIAPQMQPTAAVGKIDLPGKLGELVAKTPTGTEKGQINPQAEKGVAGLPGAPKINYAVAFLWAVWVGWIFATVGAFGGIMAGVGHMTLFALGAYAASFESTNPDLNKLLTDTIKVSNQYLVGLAALISTWNFYRMKRLVVPLGATLGLGSLAGAALIARLTAGKLKFNQYQGWFGIIVLVIGAFMFYGMTERGRAKKKAEDATAKELQMMKEKGTADGVKTLSLSFSRISFSFYGAEFSFNPVLAVIGGLIISAISAFLGVGGGFLYVPFLTDLVGLPMYIAAGTSAFAVLLSMISSIYNYAAAGAFISWGLVGVEMAGVFAGAMIGPRTQKYIPEKWLKMLFIFLAVYVGIAYFSKGFFGHSWLPMG